MNVASRWSTPLIWLLLLTHALLGTAYIVGIPPGEAPDEPSHVRNTEVIRQYHQLPTMFEGSSTYSYEAIQPPLYYLLQAGWTYFLGLDSKLMPPIKPNPLFSFRNDTALNVYLHEYPAREAVPIYLMRLLSLIMGLATIALIWRAAQIAYPLSQEAHLLAVSFASLLPGFTFTSARVSNDSLAALLGAALLVSLLSLMRNGLTTASSSLVGLVFGVGLLTKLSFLPLFVVVLVVAFLARTNNMRSRLAGIAALGCTACLAGMWPFIINMSLYGDPLGAEITHTVYRNVASPLADVPNFWLAPGYVMGLFDSLWGVFGLRNISLPGVVYGIYYALCALALAGLFHSLYKRRMDRFEKEATLLMLSIFVLVYTALAQYNTQFWSIQGRLLLPAYASLVLLIGRGLALFGTDVFPTPGFRRAAGGILLLVLLVLNFYAFISHIVLVYR